MISLIYVAGAAICNAIMDNISSYDTFGRYFKRKKMPNLSFWSRKASWSNKYEIANWLTQTFKIPLSITTKLSKQIFVMISDAWHFFKVIMLLCYSLAITNYVSSDYLFIPVPEYLLFLIFWLYYSIIFSIFFKGFKLLNKND